jgi:2-oxo-4-hydroxy-4-carboxy--5-ureidoimidazoline (OHCU) decarboxylase
MSVTAQEKVLKKIKEEAFVSRINEVFEDPEVVAEQRQIADDIADNTEVQELPW